MNLEMLKKAMEPLAQFGKDEIEITVNDTVVVLRTLLPAEEIACQKYASGVLEQIRGEIDLENDQMSRHGALDYFDKFRIEVISWAIIKIGSLDLRDTQLIETGEFLDNGLPKKITRQLAMRQLIQESWSRGMITICFSKYGDLVTKIAEKAEKVAEKSIADLQAEIERVEKKLEGLKQEKDKRALGDPSVTAKQIQNLVEVGKTMEKELDTAAKQAEKLKTAREQEKELEKELEQIRRENPIPEAPKVEPEPPKRKQVIPEEVPPPTSGPNQEEMIRKAREATSQNPINSSVDPLSAATPIGSVQGVEAYRLPAQTLSDRGQKVPQRRAEVDPDPSKSSMNPNFKPRR